MDTTLGNTPAPRLWQALNPAIYLVSILPGLTIYFLATQPINHTALWAAITAVVLLQHAINLFNDAKDWQLGADTEKYNSWVRFHQQRPALAFYHGLISLFVGSLLGLGLLYHEGMLWLALWSFPLVFLGIAYNLGDKPLSYTAFGEWATGLCYGPGVFAGLWLVAAQPINWQLILLMLAYAGFAMALLLSHQPPQIETDAKAGKLSFAVRHGTRKTLIITNVLLAATYLILSVFYCFIWYQKYQLHTIAYLVVSLLVLVSLIKLTPNPKRIMLATTLVFVVGLLPPIIESL